MLFGIALHGALAYLPGGGDWPVADSETSPVLAGLVAFTHGFRMPLFFVLSGIFAAMLVSKRGIRGLVKHRVQRILVPLGLGCLTIVPAVWALAIFAEAGNPTYAVPESQENLWSATAKGDLEQTRKFLDWGWPVDEPDPFYRQTPMAWAIHYNHPAVVDLLIASGADPNAKHGEQDLDTHLHAATFFGRFECARALIDAGADLRARNGYGETPEDSMRHGKEVVTQIGSILGVEIDFDEIRAGRARIRDLLATRRVVEDSSAAMASDTSGSESGGGGSGIPFRAILMGLTVFPFFHHLWFLWLLMWLVVPFAAVAAILSAKQIRARPPWWLVASPAALLWLVPLTALAQSGMFSGLYIPGFGPDTSAGLLPIPFVLAYYAIFFFFGALVYVTPTASERLGGGWWALLPLAFAIFPAAIAVSTMNPSGYELVGDELTRRMISPLGQALFCWLMVLGSVGLCRRLLSGERRWVRYLSDSSYWLYLAHLPLVIVGQMLLQPLPLPGLAKFGLLVVGSTAILLASYEWGVRYTFVGARLNGPRTRPAD